MAATGALSAFLNHDIVCYAFAPIVGTALLRKQINPVPFLIALAIASNIGAAATFIGNPQDMMISQVAQLNFGRYILWSVVPVAVCDGRRLRNHLATVAKKSSTGGVASK